METLFTIEKDGRRAVVRAGADAEALANARALPAFADVAGALDTSAIRSRQEAAGWDEFAEKYRPIHNTIRGVGEGEPPEMFDTSGEEYEFVVERRTGRTVWTLVSCDDGLDRILPGLHLVNRVGHFVTELPYEDASEEFIF
jgi:hypothetical protein